MKSIALMVAIAATVATYGCGSVAPMSSVAPASKSQQMRPMDSKDVVTKSCGNAHPGQSCGWWTEPNPWDIHYVNEEAYGGGDGLFSGSNTLYIGNGNSIYVQVKKKYKYTLTGLTGAPIGIAADSKGTVWASNSPSNVLSEFPAGETKASATYTDTNLTSLSYVAVDRFDNVYVEGQGSSGIEVDELSTASGTFTPIGQPGELGAIAGGLAFQKEKTGSYLWINDQGTSSGSGRLTQWVFQNGALKKVASFGYAGRNGAIWADPSGKDIKHIFATNNVPYGTEVQNKGVEYELPDGKIVSESGTGIESAEDVGITGFVKKYRKDPIGVVAVP